MKSDVVNRNSFILRAREGENTFWRYAAGVLVILVFYLVLGTVPFYMVYFDEMRSGVGNNLEILYSEGNKNLLYLLLVLPSIVGFFAVLGVVRLIHFRPVLSVMTAFEKFRWGRFFWGFGFFGVIVLGSELILFFIYPENYVFSYAGTDFWILLALATLIIPFQAGFEEIFLRGYLIQGLGLWRKNAIIPVFVTAVIFGFLHSGNPEIREFGFMTLMPYYIGFGFFLGLIAIMDDGLEMAIGIHTVNNWYLSALVTFKSSALQTYALYEMLEMKIELMFIFFIVGCLLFLFASAYRYGWRNWKIKLTGRL